VTGPDERPQDAPAEAPAPEAEGPPKTSQAPSTPAEEPEKTPPPPAPRAWRNRAEAAEELGISRQKLVGMRTQGAPVPPEGEIEVEPLLLWAWQNRERVVGEKRARELAVTIDNQRKAETLRGQQIDNALKEKDYVARAQSVFNDAIAKLRRALERDLHRGAARRLVELLAIEDPAERERQVTAKLCEIGEACIEEALR
jgi:hypothetical protein